jgi:hypothetical protein
MAMGENLIADFFSRELPKAERNQLCKDLRQYRRFCLIGGMTRICRTRAGLVNATREPGSEQRGNRPRSHEYLKAAAVVD